MRKAKSASLDEPRTEELRAADQAIASMTFEKGKGGAAAMPQFRRILVGVDGTGSSSMAVSWAHEIAKTTGAKVIAATVLGPAAKGPFARDPKRAELAQREERLGREVLERSAAGLEKDGLDVTAVLTRGFPAFEILRIADHKHVDLIVMGSHGHSGRERMLIGSVADSIKNNASCSVLVAKAPFGPGSVVVPVDGSPDSRAAAAMGIRLGRHWHAETQIYHVFEPPVFYDPEDARDQFQNILDDMDLPPAPAGVRYLLEIGHPWRRIVDFVETHRPRLVVMGARGHSKLRKLVTGTTSNHLVHEGSSSVLLVRRRR